MATQRIRRSEDIARIEFVNDMATIDVPVEALDILPLKNEKRLDSQRLRRVACSIRRNGYSSLHPAIARLGRRERWVIENGGHRLTAARLVAKEFFTNLFRRKVYYIHFLLYRTPLSRTGVIEIKIDDDKPSTGDTLERQRQSGRCRSS